MDKLVQSIKKHEGFSSKLYKDNKGIYTIGYGTNIENISITEAELLLNHRLKLAKNDVKKVFESDILYSMDSTQRAALYEFMYWLGLPTFKKFKKMIKAIEESNYIEASRQMLDSRVGREYKTRVTKLAEMLRGEY